MTGRKKSGILFTRKEAAFLPEEEKQKLITRVKEALS